ncbi:MAG: protein kinase [bacterium]
MTADTPGGDFLERIRARLGDRYEISRELLGGGMSRVFVAREIALDRQIVIKFLPPEIAAEANRDRFRREIQMAARLSHPHIAPLFSAAEEGELLYYTMPFIPGESLKHSLDSGHRFGIGETVEILRDVAAALAYAHRAGIVHRDIKPANILREGEHAVVTDFGVAKAVSQALGLDTRTSAATASGMAIGTPAYMAPEQLAGDSAADHRVDIYAFGLLGYELLTGHSPFRGPSPQALMAAQLTQPPPPLLEARADVPPVLAALLTRCLEKDASQRPPSAESVIEVLRAVSTASGAVHLAAPPSRSPAFRMPLAVASVLAAAALVFAYVARMPAPPVVPVARDSAVSKPVVATPAPDVSAFTRAERDSLRVLSEQIARKEQRLLGLLKDSISNAVHRTVAESLAQAKQLELATARVQDSLMRVSRAGLAFQPRHGPMPPDVAVNLGGIKGLETFTRRTRDSVARGLDPSAFGTSGFMQSRPLPSEAFAVRAANLGPSRRIGISVSSVVRGGPATIAANSVMDSLLARFRQKSRFTTIPADSVAAALSRSHNIDSLRTWLNAEVWASIGLSGPVGADSVYWMVTLRDFTAHSAFSYRPVLSKYALTGSSPEPATISALLDNVVQSLDAMDRAPRREPAPTRSAKPPGE